jgi:hypothetical protein
MSLEGNILAFDALDDPPGIEIIDRVERLRYQLHTPEPVSPTSVDPEGFLFPVDRAFSIATDALALPMGKSVCVRDGSGEMLTEVGHLEEQSVDEGASILELGAQIKTYVRVAGPVTISVGLAETRIDFGEERTVEVGAVSWHDRPATTVTTTADPVDMMAAVSTFGTALKATNPERSFPSNRGHPPAIELGTSLDVPEAVQPPETGIQIEVPPDHGAVYVVAPLAYYLGAEVVPGPQPRLTTETGFDHPLDTPGGLERGVERVLKQVFVLDCVARTEGVYNIELRERNELEGRLAIDWQELYDCPVAEQVATYLDIPYAVLEDTVPEWRLTVHVEPDSETIEQIPFVVDDLAIVRTADTATTGEPAAGPRAPDALSRDGVVTRSAAEASTGHETSYVEPQSSSSLEQAWIGDRIPIGASKLTMEAFQNRLDRDASAGDISITIALNDSRMAEERDIVNQVYGDRDDLPFDVRVCRNLTVSELREQLGQECSFFHYIGHTERDGFQCADGKLDASALDTTGIDSFLLNACNSYHQGLGLIDAGAIGGIVTLNEIINDDAVQIGETIARLLNGGFPLRAALTIAREESVLGGQYIVVGDGGMTVTQAPSRTPNLLRVSPEEDGFAVDIETYATDDAGLGTIYKPHIDGNDEFFLNSGNIATFQLSEAELATFFELENVPVRVSDTLHWSFSLDPGEIG